jgi:hypothetical protein
MVAGRGCKHQLTTGVHKQHSEVAHFEESTAACTQRAKAQAHTQPRPPTCALELPVGTIELP